MREITMSPSSTLANRSFLYGGSGNSSSGAAAAESSRPASSCLISDNIVYATLDSLTLRRATLPLRLLPVDDEKEEEPIKTNSSEAVSKSGSDIASSAESDEEPAVSQPAEFEAIAVVIPAEPSEPSQNGTANNKIELNGSVSPSPKSATKSKNNQPQRGGSCDNKKFTFAKNVLHYVPMTSRRYYRKSRNLASKSLSLKSLGLKPPADDIFASGGLKSRSLSRDELKYVTISMPSNFVHVASATKSSLMEAAEAKQRRCIEHKGKYADLRGEGYAELKHGGKETVINESFLWMTLPRVKEVKFQNSEADYDDVGPPVLENGGTEKINGSIDENPENQIEETEQDDYDDVGPPTVYSASSSCSNEKPTLDPINYDDDVYDDVGPMNSGYEIPLQLSPSDKKPSEKQPDEEDQVQLRESSVDEPAVDEDVYDDVGLPMPQPSQECHERVNSLYAGSSVSGSIKGYNYYDKESEWEDLDDSALYGINEGAKPSSEPSHSTSSSPSKKKLACQRWSHKVRRQRSKASRKSSARSTSRSRKQPVAATLTTSDTRAYSVAVSLGTGSVLLLGALPESSDGLQAEVEPVRSAEEFKGLVQLRVLLQADDDDEQETSLYICEDSSDDSNYETLETYEPDDFSSDSEAEGSTNPPSVPINPALHLSLQEPPCRPVPPPPREASLLGNTLGRRMKMLRRTWSITKCSLGRMRRRASGEGDTSGPESSVNNDARKYFSFKRPFKKSQTAALSTFYLDKTAGAEKEADEKAEKEEPIYSNSNWYREAGLYRSEESEHSIQTSIDHYSVLAEEPLYQFYTAAATRVAFESDSDGYEEVEELTPSAATTDLAKPGHRTLWCQTPQVINSGLLQSLTMEERKIQEAKFEILTSEASYLNSLRVLENEFASNYELTQEILTSAEREKLFGSVPEVLVASERFLAELEAIWREDPMLNGLPELLLKHGDRSCQTYVDYCSNQVSIDTTLKDLRAKKGYKFLETVSRIEMHPACHSLSLHSFLMLPMQRITRLPLLADAVLSKLSVDHSERLSWELVLSALSQIVAKCNEGAKLAERQNEMDALARKLEYSAKVPPISLHDRELIRSGTVIHLSSRSDNEYKLTFGRKFHKTPLMLMLLTDYILVTKLKSNSNDEVYSVMETCKRSLVALEAVPEDSPLAGRHAMVLTLLENHAGRQVEYVITCESDTEKERWLDAVSPPKPSCLGETLYESWDCPQVMALYSYATRQPDELTLQPGDVINVLRKMNDGWLFGEKLLDGEQGWFPGNFTKEVASEHVRARNLRQRHRFLALSGSVLQRKAKQSLSLL